MGLLKKQNLEHKYRTIKIQLLRKINGAQSSINKKPIPPKDIGSHSWNLVKGPWIDSHDPRPIMSPQICITLLLKLAKRDKK